jgi:hypothetical protein
VGSYVQKLGYQLFYYDEIIGEFPPSGLGPCTYLIAHCPEVTYSNQIDLVKDFLAAHEQSGGTTMPEHSSVVVNSVNKNELIFTKNSVVVDPWRKIPQMKDITVIHYGDTRSRLPA